MPLTMDTNMVLDFMQNQRPLGLAQIGQVAGQKIAQRRDRKQWEAMEQSYNNAMEAMIANPSEENAARLEAAALPLGRSDETNRAISDYFKRQAEEGPMRNPALDAIYNEAQTTFFSDSRIENQDAFIRAGTLTGREDQARQTINDHLGRTPESTNTEARDDLIAKEAVWREDIEDLDAQLDVLMAAELIDDGTYSNYSQIIDRALAGLAPDGLDATPYDRALQQWIDTRSDADLVRFRAVASASGRLEEGTQTVADLEQRWVERAAAEEIERKENAHDESTARMLIDMSPANIAAAIETGTALGLAEETQAFIATMKDEERLAIAREALSVAAPLANGEVGMALEALDQIATGYEGTDDGEAERWREIEAMVKAGDTDDALGLIVLEASLIPEFAKGWETFYKQGAETRADTSLALDIFTKSAAVSLTPAARVRLTDAARADEEFGETILNAINYTLAAKNGVPMDEDDIADLTLDLNKRFFDRTGGLQNATVSNQKIQDIYSRSAEEDGGAAGTYTDPETGQTYEISGMADLSIVQLYQRQVDEATVRQSDIDNIQATVGGAGAIERWFNQLFLGHKLAPEQRREISELSELLLEAQTDYVDQTVFPSIEAMRHSFNAAVGNEAINYASVYGEFVRPEDRVAEEERASAITPTVTETKDSAEYEVFD